MAKEKDDPIDAFKAWAEGCGSSLVLGLDPGVTGAMGFLSGRLAFALDMPVYKVEKITKHKGKAVKGESSHYDNQTIVEVFEFVRERFTDATVFLERGSPMPRDTAMTAFKIGWNTGMYPLLFTCLDLAYELVQPSVWKQRMGVGPDKKASIAMAARLFPKISLARKKDHNRAEALLLAEYGRRRLAGKT